MDLSKLAPADAVVALRGLERRYRALFADLGDDESPDDIARRQVAGWSAIEHIVAAARAIGAADHALAAVLTRSKPPVAPADVGYEARPHPGVPSGTVHERLAELGFEATTLADRIVQVSAHDWEREGVVDDGSGRHVTALDIVRAAVDAGVTHLRRAEEVVAAVTG